MMILVVCVYGLIAGRTPLANITNIEVEIYHLFPLDSGAFDHRVPTRNNSPSDVEIGSATSHPAINNQSAGTWNIQQHYLSGAVNPNSITFNNSGSFNALDAAFGGAFNQTPNPLDPDTAASNSEIISINNTTQVPGSDVRNQYFMTGATWTIGGAAPSGLFPSGNEVGTSRLANTTMETYGQGTANTVTVSDSNCFSCHVTNKVMVSHVFCDPSHGCGAGLQPLFP